MPQGVARAGCRDATEIQAPIARIWHVIGQRGLIAEPNEDRADVNGSAPRGAHWIAPVIQRRAQDARGNECKPGLLNAQSMTGRTQRQPCRPPYHVGVRLSDHQIRATHGFRFLVFGVWFLGLVEFSLLRRALFM